jgi:cyclophilin family peptidyl-prolyl cis-trans isomerase
MVSSIISAIVMASVLVPAKTWYAPSQPLTVTVSVPEESVLRLTDFAGRPIESDGPTEVVGERTIDVKEMFPPAALPGTYLLYALPAGASSINDFVGTPLVINVRVDKRRGAPLDAMVTRVEPLAYGTMTTEQGEMTVAFYYDVAPNTVASFQSLASGGYFDGLTFHRIVPGFIIQSGDPRGNGTGGPGYNLGAEFSDRPHEEGVLSMARTSDPNEGPGVPPRPEFANSAGSQFFIALDYNNTKQLDRRYTVFGKIIGPAGFEALRTIAGTPLADESTGEPVEPPVIKRVEIKPVTAKENPYAVLQASANPPSDIFPRTTQPSTRPTIPVPPALQEPPADDDAAEATDAEPEK